MIRLVPDDALWSPPSREHGIDESTETQLRVYGCELIQKAGTLLKLQAVTKASAQVILHRFYYRKSFAAFDVRRTAAACVVLAGKMEEDCRRVQDIITVFYHLQQKEEQPDVNAQGIPPLDPSSQVCRKMESDVLRIERYLLRELGFMMERVLRHPHTLALQYINMIKGLPRHHEVATRTWGYLNDSLRTNLCCRVQPEVIAAASVYLACCDLSVALPRESRWYELLEVDWRQLEMAARTILKLYTLPAAKYIDVKNNPAAQQQQPAKDALLPTPSPVPAASSVDEGESSGPPKATQDGDDKQLQQGAGDGQAQTAECGSVSQHRRRADGPSEGEKEGGGKRQRVE
ncbi:unnamed protein product [Vitrella brassicaformis CCMP3155]|uniref:Cyclin-like domain-containing protein n=1 Tax=Vitrella brassicaformis (strain CCMP3155) TaxID=1169540 RepID=A0A0G4ENT7_VITBC|nr:unnamed protein product [Vitrella brassicaformis CCMP3155]|mmetsp:Transcript_5779/g.13827  ORF Transcript_5779/g.13827 Transcript_5779/m.13827 type:complete len:346 (-) Transcript_5779:2177-3214(-)|eukprot:CEL98528.1 unnamed protein product [Vitrella brassicaformis CCMP3155]